MTEQVLFTLFAPYMFDFNHLYFFSLVIFPVIVMMNALHLFTEIECTYVLGNCICFAY